MGSSSSKPSSSSRGKSASSSSDRSNSSSLSSDTSYSSLSAISALDHYQVDADTGPSTALGALCNSNPNTSKWVLGGGIGFWALLATVTTNPALLFGWLSVPVCHKLAVAIAHNDDFGKPQFGTVKDTVVNTMRNCAEAVKINPGKGIDYPTRNPARNKRRASTKYLSPQHESELEAKFGKRGDGNFAKRVAFIEGKIKNLVMAVTQEAEKAADKKRIQEEYDTSHDGFFKTIFKSIGKFYAGLSLADTVGMFVFKLLFCCQHNAGLKARINNTQHQIEVFASHYPDAYKQALDNTLDQLPNPDSLEALDLHDSSTSRLIKRKIAERFIVGLIDDSLFKCVDGDVPAETRQPLVVDTFEKVGTVLNNNGITSFNGARLGSLSSYSSSSSPDSSSTPPSSSKSSSESEQQEELSTVTPLSSPTTSVEFTPDEEPIEEIPSNFRGKEAKRRLSVASITASKGM